MGDLRKGIHELIGNEVEEGKIDEYSELFDEPTQVWTIELSFNMGDPRTLKIKLDINPDV